MFLHQELPGVAARSSSQNVVTAFKDSRIHLRIQGASIILFVLGTGCLGESLRLAEVLTRRTPVIITCFAVKSIRVSVNQLLSSWSTETSTDTSCRVPWITQGIQLDCTQLDAGCTHKPDTQLQCNRIKLNFIFILWLQLKFHRLCHNFNYSSAKHCSHTVST